MRHTFVIWDDCPRRINEMEPRLRMALSDVGMDAEIHIHNERPLLARNKMLGATPAFQLDDGDLWRLHVGKSVTVDEFKALLNVLRHTEKRSKA